MKYTKAERHRIYKKAMKILPDEGYICFAVGRITTGRTFSDPKELMDFPEIWKQKPRRSYVRGTWFRDEDIESRIAILREAIEQTKPKKK